MRRRTFLLGALSGLLPRAAGAEVLRPFAPGLHVLTTAYRPPSGATVDLTGVTLRHQNNTRAQTLIDLSFVDGVTIRGGTLDGNVGGQQTWNEFLMAIKVLSSTNVLIDGVTFQNLSGDGVYISYSYERTPKLAPRDVTVRGCRFLGDNRNRNGVSIIMGRDLEVVDCYFSRMARRGMPGAIDIEPDERDEVVSGVWIHGCTIEGPGPRGVTIANGTGPAQISDVRIENNTIDRQRTGIVLRGHQHSNESGVVVRYNTISKAKVGIEIGGLRASISKNAFRGCRDKFKRKDKRN